VNNDSKKIFLLFITFLLLTGISSAATSLDSDPLHQLLATSGKISYFSSRDVTWYCDGAAWGEKLGETCGTDDATKYWYVAMRWLYVDAETGSKEFYAAKDWWHDKKILVTNPSNGKQVVLAAKDWGPNEHTGRVIDVSETALNILGTVTDATVNIEFADQNSALGLVSGSSHATNTIAWEFNTPADREGWLAYNAGILNEDTNVQDDGLFIVDPIGPDPWIENNGLSIDASSVDGIKIRMSSNCEDDTGAIYFSTAESPGFDEGKKVGFSVSHGSEWHEYDISVSENSNWKGTITGLRIDPADYGSESLESHDDTFGFDYIHLSGVPTETDTPSDQDTPPDEVVTPDSPTTPPAPAQSTVYATYYVEDPRISEAIKWAKDKTGSIEYPYYCLRFVQRSYSYGAKANIVNHAKAKISAIALEANKNNGIPPRGAFVFYEWTSAKCPDCGHVGLSLGDGNIIHAYGENPVNEAQYTKIGLKYIGWAYPLLTPPINNMYPLSGNLYGSTDKKDITGIFNSSTSKFTFGSKSVQFGLDTDIPVIGDWDGDGKDEIGVFRPLADDGRSKFYLVTRNWSDLGDKAGDADVCIDFGPYPTNVPITGDWDGDGYDDIGGFNPENNVFYLYKLDLDMSSAKSHKDVPFGATGDIPFIGDWDGDGKDELGVFRSPYPVEKPETNAFYCDRKLTGGPHELGDIGTDGKPKPYKYGDLRDYPVIGDWDGDGDDDIGVYRPHNKKFCKDSTIPVDPGMGADIVAIIRTYGSHEGDDDYNPVHDVNSDGVINLSDVVGALKDTIMGMLNSISL